MRCKTKSFYAQGLKVRSGEGHILLDGSWKSVVLTAPVDGEVHVRDIPDGASISMPDGLVLQVWQDRLFGKKGRRVDVKAELEKFSYRWHETLYFKRLLQTNDDPAILRVALERDLTFDTRPMVGFMKRNQEATQRLFEEFSSAPLPMSTSARVLLLHGVTDEKVLLEGVKNIFSAHVALPRLVEIASEDVAIGAVEEAIQSSGSRSVAYWCQNLPGEFIEKVLLRLVQRVNEADATTRDELEENLLLFVTGGIDPYRINATPAVVAKAASRLMDQGVVFPESVMRKRGNLRLQTHSLASPPAPVWKRVGEQVQNGAKRVTSRRGRVACVLELPVDSPELRLLLNSEDIEVRRAVLERLDDADLWREALDAGERDGFFAERAPKAVLTEYLRDDADRGVTKDASDALVRVARARGCLTQAIAEGLSCSVQGLYTARHSDDPAELDAVLRAAVDTERGMSGDDWILPVRIIDEVVARTRDYAQLVWLREAIAQRDKMQYFTPRIDTRMRELELSELAWQAKARGETLMARGAMSQMEADDLLWEMNGDEVLGKYAGERLVAALTVPEPF